MKKAIKIVVVVVIVAIILIAGFLIYKNNNKIIDYTLPPDNQEQVGTDELPVIGGDQNGENGISIEVDGDGVNGGLTICKDECGNGTCQETTDATNINAICAETAEDCPQDCAK